MSAELPSRVFTEISVRGAFPSSALCGRLPHTLSRRKVTKLDCVCVCVYFFVTFKETRHMKGGRDPSAEGTARRCNFTFHKWKNCSIDLSHYFTAHNVFLKKAIKEKLSFNLSREGVFMRQAEACCINPSPQRLFRGGTAAPRSPHPGPGRGSPGYPAESGRAQRGSQWGPHPHALAAKCLRVSPVKPSSFPVSTPGLLFSG